MTSNGGVVVDKNNNNSKSAPSSFVPKGDWILLSQGAEARVWKIPAGSYWTSSNNNHSITFDTTVIAKERFSKAYRHPVLDEKLTKQRCRAEAKILEKCSKKGNGGLHVPTVKHVDAPILYIEYLENQITLRECIEKEIAKNNSTQEEDDKQVERNNSRDNKKDDDNNDELSPILTELATLLGHVLANLHNLGIVHGDLTTSNMMIRTQNNVDNNNAATENPTTDSTKKQQTLYFIDFGLSKNTESAEERAVDIYVLERTLTSTHPKLSTKFIKIALDIYSTKANKSNATLARLEQVRLRGRKRECFG